MYWCFSAFSSLHMNQVQSFLMPPLWQHHTSLLSAPTPTGSPHRHLLSTHALSFPRSLPFLPRMGPPIAVSPAPPVLPEMTLSSRPRKASLLCLALKPHGFGFRSSFIT